MPTKKCRENFQNGYPDLGIHMYTGAGISTVKVKASIGLSEEVNPFLFVAGDKKLEEVSRDKQLKEEGVGFLGHHLIAAANVLTYLL